MLVTDLFDSRGIQTMLSHIQSQLDSHGLCDWVAPSSGSQNHEAKSQVEISLPLIVWFSCSRLIKKHQ